MFNAADLPPEIIGTHFGFNEDYALIPKDKSDFYEKELQNFLIALRKEMDESKFLQIIGMLIITMSDNAFFISLNLGSSAVIGELLNLSPFSQKILSYILLISGIFTTTSIDIYTSGSVIKKAQRLIRRLQLTPDYYKQTIIVTLVSTIVSIIGVSGMTLLVHRLYKENKFLSMFFPMTATLVNLFSALFFNQSLFDKALNYKNKQRNENDETFLVVKYLFSRMNTNIKNIDEDKINLIKLQLDVFNKKLTPTPEDMNDIIRSIKPLFCKNLTYDYSNGIKKKQTKHCIDNKYSSYLMSVPVMVIAMLLYFLVGRGTITNLDNNSTHIDTTTNIILETYGFFVGICLALIVGLTTVFSAGHFFNKFVFDKSNYEEMCNTRMNAVTILGKAIVLSVIAFLSSLYTADLVNIYGANLPKAFQIFLYFASLLPPLLMNLNALSELNLYKKLQDTYAAAGQCCLNKADSIEIFSSNIESFIKQLNLVSIKDITQLHDLLNHYGLLEKEGTEHITADLPLLDNLLTLS